MPVHIYTSDFRDKDGEVLTAKDVSSNVSDIESVANGLDWMSVQGRSLDQYHVAAGEQPKVAKGEYRPRAVLGGSWTEVAGVSVPVSPGDGIYAVGNVVYPGISAGSQINSNNSPGDVHAGAIYGVFGVSNPMRLKIASTTPAPGWAASAGEHEHIYMDNPEVHGQAGIVWAYQVTDLTSLPDGSEHRISLKVQLVGGFPNMPLNPIRASLVVFAVHR